MRRGYPRGAASTEVEQELKSTRTSVCVAGAKVVGGPAWRASGWDLEAPRGGVQLCAHTTARALHVEFVPRIDSSVACYRSGVFAFGGY